MGYITTNQQTNEREFGCAEIRAKCKACDNGNSSEDGAECMYCGIPIKALERLKGAKT